MTFRKLDIDRLDEIQKTLDTTGHILSALGTSTYDFDRNTLNWLGDILWSTSRSLRHNIDLTEPPVDGDCQPAAP